MIKEKEYQTHPCWCGEQQICDCISEPNDNDYGPFWCKYPDENGNKIPMTKLKGSRVLTKKEMEQYNKVKLPF
jgi:hypothetical protein